MAGNRSSDSVETLLSRQATALGSLTGTSGLFNSAQTSALTDQLTSIGEQLQQLQSINQTLADTMLANTTAIQQNTSSHGSTGSTEGASSIAGTIESFLGIGSGLSPLISGLISLFGGGGGSHPAPLTPYIQPLPIQLNAGFGNANAGAVFAVTPSEGGAPNPIPATGAASTVSSAGPQITVQVRAMDSQSFLDHSNDIAMAVRQAMLETTVLNDVIRGV